MSSCLTLPPFLKTLKRDAISFTHLGKDGVIRTVSRDNTVLDARGLNPAEIKVILDILPFEAAQKEELRGVDGSVIVDYQKLYHPVEGILPVRGEGGEGGLGGKD